MNQTSDSRRAAPSGCRTLLAGLLLGGATVAAVLVAVSWFRRSPSADELVHEAKRALARRNPSAAAALAERAVRAAPDFSPAWKVLAEAASRDGQTDRALESLERLAVLQPDDASKLGVQLGSFWMKANRIGPAHAALKIAAQANVAAPEPYRLRAQIAAVTGHTREVQACLVELIRRNAFTRNDLMALTSHNPVVSDPKRLKEILAAAADDKRPWLAYAQEEMNINRIDAAQGHLSMIVEAHPDDLEAQALLGQLYADFQPHEFLAWHARLPSEAEDDGRIWLARGKWLQRQGQIESAIRCLHEAVVREPELLSATVLLGQLLTSCGEAELGRQWTERGLRLQRIIDLSSRMKEPRAQEWLDEMIAALEETGRLWEAWGWCALLEQSQHGRDASVSKRKAALAAQLSFELPRTRPGSLPGESFDWDRFPLPDWSQLKSAERDSPRVAEGNPSRIRFEDRAEAVGIDFRYVNSYLPERGRKIYEAMGAGVAVLDYDLDGWPDLYFPQGKTWPLDADGGPSDALYRNVFGERFLAATESAAIHETTYSQGAAAGDFDNDGFPDVYVANLGRNRLFRNNGDGTFADVTEQAGLKQDFWTVSCAIADLDGDGLPELFDVNYVQSQDLLTGTCLDDHNRPTVCRPTVFDDAVDTVAVNLGDGRFVERQSEAGLMLPQGMGLGLVVADLNGDRRLDLFVANDQTANYLLINEQTGPDQRLTFRDEAHVRGAALDFNGLAQACMGVACADVNRDGQPDFYVTNFAQESNTLYLSQAGGLYQDATQLVGLRGPSFNPLGFGTQFFDADRDGWYDLAVVNGHIDEFIDQPFHMKAQFFRGLPDGTFRELFAPEVGTLFDKPRLGRGMAILDWNRDGRTDFVATDLDGPVLLAENQTEPSGRSLRIKLVGTQSSRDAIGAKVKAFLSSAEERVDQLTAGDGYESSNERTIEIGLGGDRQVATIEIHWPSGAIERALEVPNDGEWLVIEGSGAWTSLK